MPQVLLFYDYIDPLSWVVDTQLDVLDTEPSAGDGAADAPRVVQRVPFELIPPDEAEPALDSSAWSKRVAHAIAASEQAGLPYVPAPSVPRSRKAIELAFHAHEHGVFDRVHRMLFEAHLSRGLDIGRVDVLVTLAVEAGLDRSETKAVLDVDRHAASVEVWRAKAREIGVTDTPAIHLGGRLHQGWAAVTSAIRDAFGAVTGDGTE